MILGFGTKCPAWDYVVGMGDTLASHQHCRYCLGRLGVYANGVDCGYSKIPTHDAKFGVGDTVFYVEWPNLPFKIRKVEWDGKFGWVYYFARERTPRDESKVFRTQKEAEEAVIRGKVEGLRKKIESYCKRYGEPIEAVTRMLLPGAFETTEKK